MLYKYLAFSLSAFSLALLLIWRLRRRRPYYNCSIDSAFGSNDITQPVTEREEVADMCGDSDSWPELSYKRNQIMINKMTCNVLSKLEKSKLFTFLPQEEVDEITRDLARLKKLVSPDESERASFFTATEDHRDVEVSSFCSFREISDSDFLSAEEDFTQSVLTLYRRNPQAIRFSQLWTDRVGVESDDVYLTRLYCIRRGFERLAGDRDFILRLEDAGRLVLRQLLSFAPCKGSADSVVEVYDRLVEHVRVSSQPNLREEMETMGVAEFGLYDFLFDYVILKSLHLADNPPSLLIGVIESRFLPNYVKETALSTAVSSLISLKMRLLKDDEVTQFRRLLYSLADKVLPRLSWGFFGPETPLSRYCVFLKGLLTGLCLELYADDSVFCDLNLLCDHIVFTIDSKIHIINNIDFS